MEQSNGFWLTSSATDTSPSALNNLSGATQHQNKDTDLTSMLNQPSMMNFATIFAGATAAAASSGANMLSGPRMPPLNQVTIPPASQLSKGTSSFLPVPTLQTQTSHTVNPLASALPTPIISSTVPNSLNTVTPLTTTIYTLPLPTDPIHVPKSFIQQAVADSGLTVPSSGQNTHMDTNAMTPQRVNNVQRVSTDTPLSTTNQDVQSGQTVPPSPARPVSVQRQQQPYHCLECNKSFESTGQLSYHTFVSHAQLQARPHKCTACIESFFLIHHLRDHMRAIHLPPEQGGGPPFTCTECSASFDDGGHLNLHLYMAHTIQGSTQPQEQHPCPECGKNFIKASLLSAHLRNVHNGQVFALVAENPQPIESPEAKNYKCEGCGKAFKTASYLKQHMMSVHDKPLKCTMCSKGFGRKSDLKRHMRGVHMRERPHACCKCGWTFAEFSNLKHHLQAVHEKEKNFRCMYCDKTFSLSSYLRTHLVRMHNIFSEPSKTEEQQQESQTTEEDVIMRLSSPGASPSLVRLTSSGANAPDLQTLQLAVPQTHVNRCYECGNTFPNPQMLQAHVMSTHSQPFWCTVCGEGFALASQLTVHLQLRHSSDDQLNPAIQTVDLQATAPATMEITNDLTSPPPNTMNTPNTMNIVANKCPFCGEIYETEPEKHLCTWKKFDEPVAVCAAAMAFASERRHSCNECGKRFKTTTHLKQHIRCVHSKERPHKCNQCEKSFARTSDLNRHIKGVHQRQKAIRSTSFVTLKCSECGAIYAETAQLKRHIYTTHLRGRPSFKCADCQEGFPDELTFQGHICHEEERPHVCTFCSKRFQHSQQLRRHLRSAHGKNNEEPMIHRCCQCNRNFGRPIDLERHIQAVHLKEKPHKCTLCGKSFGLQGNLNKHVRAVHLQEKPHQCIECGKRFAHVGVLKRHLRDIHFYDKKITVKLKLARMQLHQKTAMQHMGPSMQIESGALKTSIMMSHSGDKQLTETIQTIANMDSHGNGMLVANRNANTNHTQNNPMQVVNGALNQPIGSVQIVNSDATIGHTLHTMNPNLNGPITMQMADSEQNTCGNMPLSGQSVNIIVSGVGALQGQDIQLGTITLARNINFDSLRNIASQNVTLSQANNVQSSTSALNTTPNITLQPNTNLGRRLSTNIPSTEGGTGTMGQISIQPGNAIVNLSHASRQSTNIPSMEGGTSTMGPISIHPGNTIVNLAQSTRPSTNIQSVQGGTSTMVPISIQNTNAIVNLSQSTESTQNRPLVNIVGSSFIGPQQMVQFINQNQLRSIPSTFQTLGGAVSIIGVPSNPQQNNITDKHVNFLAPQVSSSVSNARPSLISAPVTDTKSISSVPQTRTHFSIENPPKSNENISISKGKSRIVKNVVKPDHQLSNDLQIVSVSSVLQRQNMETQIMENTDRRTDTTQPPAEAVQLSDPLAISLASLEKSNINMDTRVVDRNNNTVPGTHSTNVQSVINATVTTAQTKENRSAVDGET